MNALDALAQIRLAMGEAAEPYVQAIRAELERGQGGAYISLKHHQDALAASQEECNALRDQLAKLRDVGWKGIAEAPYPHRGMKQSLTGLIARISEILEGRADARDEVDYAAGYAYALRTLHRHMHEMWEHRGEPTIVAEFGALYCLDSELPAQEPDDEDEE
jgi:hypothetical protein